MKFVLGFFAFALIILSFIFINQRRNTQPTEEIDRKVPVLAEDTETDIIAGFSIYTNGTSRVFTNSMYHNKSEEIFITSEKPNVVKVRKNGLTWNNFFSTLPMEVTPSCLTTGTGQSFCTDSENDLKFFINGIRDDSALSKEIKETDRLLVSFGPKEDPNVKIQIEELSNIEI